MRLRIQDGWLKLLPQFRHLQVFRGTGIWETLRQSQGKVDYHEAMESIARACPKLRHLDYAAFDDERGEHVRLLLCRRWGVNGVGGGVVNGNGLVANEESVGYGDDDNDGGEGKVLRITYHRQRPKQV